jgi:hypothetical protein
VQQEGRALFRRQAFENVKQRHRYVVGEREAFFRRRVRLAGGGDDRLGKPGTDIGLAARAGGAQLVDA